MGTDVKGSGIKALFDVFGTVVDWRGSLSALCMVLSVTLAGSVVTACWLGQPSGTVDHRARYYFEVVNQSTDRVRVNVSVGGQILRDVPAGRDRSWRSQSGIISLASDKRRTFDMSVFLGPKDTPEDNVFVTSFGIIRFYEADSDTPYVSYSYPLTGCVDDDPGCWDSGDDTRIAFFRSDGTTERLFVESPDRPFYLERDKENLDLARLLITFVPGADDGSEDSVE